MKNMIKGLLVVATLTTASVDAQESKNDEALKQAQSKIVKFIAAAHNAGYSQQETVELLVQSIKSSVLADDPSLSPKQKTKIMRWVLGALGVVTVALGVYCIYRLIIVLNEQGAEIVSLNEHLNTMKHELSQLSYDSTNLTTSLNRKLNLSHDDIKDMEDNINKQINDLHKQINDLEKKQQVGKPKRSIQESREEGPQSAVAPTGSTAPTPSTTPEPTTIPTIIISSVETDEKNN